MKWLPVLIMIICLVSGCDQLKGPTGPDGPRGEKGTTGDTGSQGEKGNTGSRGEQGTQGEIGNTGSQGDQGIQGEKGDTGDTGEIGPQGPQGEKGEAVYTEVAVDEDKGSLLITDATWSYEEGLFSSGPLEIMGIAKNTGIYTFDYVTIYTKAYNASGQIISAYSGYAGSVFDTLMPGQDTWWKITDYVCNEKPDKVTLGYSFDVTVVVPAPKKSFSAVLD